LSREVVISKTAENKLNKLFDYLIQNGLLLFKKNLLKNLDSSIEIIKNQPEIFPESKKV